MMKFITTRTQRGMAILLSADLVVFFALFVTYLYLRHQSPTWPGPFHFASGLMAFAMTLFALSGSFAMVYAARYQVSEGFEIAMRLTVAAIAVLGTVLILLAMEWVRLIFIMEVGFTTNPWGVPTFSFTYFALTGFYGLHILAGLIYLTVLAVRIRKSDAGAAALFVHFTNVVWLVILVGVYFASTDLQGL